MKKYTCFALLAFFGAAALTPVMAASGAAPAAPHDGNKKHDGHGHKNHHNHKDHKAK